jgi:hypothetical protein
MESQVLSHGLKAEEHLALPMTHIAARVGISTRQTGRNTYVSTEAHLVHEGNLGEEL